MATATVTVSSTTTTTKVSPNIHFDPGYIRTVPGLLKVAQLVVSLIGFICVQVVYYYKYHSSSGWYGFVSMTAFWVTLILLLMYLFHIIEKLHFIPWLMGEFGYCAVFAVFFLIAAIVASTNAPHDASWGAAAFFAFVAACLYAYDGYLKFIGWRGGEIAQGERTVTNSSTTNTQATPTYPTY